MDDPVLRHGFVGAASAKNHAWLINQLKEHPINLRGETGEIPPESSFIHDKITAI